MKDGRFQVQPLDGGATPDSKPPSLEDEEENYNCTHNEILHLLDTYWQCFWDGLKQDTPCFLLQVLVAKFKYNTTSCFDIGKEVSLDSLVFWLPTFLSSRST